VPSRGCCLSGVALLSLARAIKFDLVRQIIILFVRFKSRQITASGWCHRMTTGMIGSIRLVGDVQKKPLILES